MLSVGQKLWYVPNFSTVGPREVTVEKVGRKWASIGRHRIDVNTLVVEMGKFSSPGRCYLSKQEYEDIQELHRAWWAFRGLVAGSPPKGLTREKIEQAKIVLGITGG